MSSRTRNRDIPVKMVRILRQEKPVPFNYADNVTVGMPKDDETDDIYLRIAVNKKTILSEQLDNLKWLDDCCSKGVVTLQSISMKIIIIYDAINQQSREFFEQLDTYYHGEEKDVLSASSKSIDQVQEYINNLVKSIENGSVNDVERAVKYLAKHRTKVQFGLASYSDGANEKRNKKRNESNDEDSNDILELKLQIECHLNRDALIETIYVRNGTILRELKDQIEQETGISSQDQFWFASGQYIINDDYEFGSNEPIEKPRSKKQTSKEIIKSGDTLIMLIAQTVPPY